MKKINTHGFSLIEVLLALAILAIGLTALIKANVTSIAGTRHLQQKNMGHLVAMQAAASIQLGLTPMAKNQETTAHMQLFGVQWYWRAQIKPTGLDKVDSILITTSTQAYGPFHDPLLTFRVSP